MEAEAGGNGGLPLRAAYLYGPGPAYASDGAIADRVRRRRLPVVGAGDAVSSFVHVIDAAMATLRAVEGGSCGVYNIVDDDPAPSRDWLPIYAQALGAPPPPRLPTFAARLIGGAIATSLLPESPGAPNAKAKRDPRGVP